MKFEFIYGRIVPHDYDLKGSTSLDACVKLFYIVGVYIYKFNSFAFYYE